MTPRLLILATCLTLLVLSACSSGAAELEQLVDTGTHSLYLHCTGKGKPVVIIDTGVGDTAERWQDFQTRVAELTRVCTYDRAGYGTSEPGPLPRDTERVAGELRALLENARIKGPFVLVGHSLGALNVQVFADRYPDQVAGLILLDPTPLPFITGQAFPELYRMFEQQAVELQQVAAAARQSDDPEAQAQSAYLEAIASENAALIAESAAQLSAIRSFGALPLIVIGSGKPNPAFGEQAEAFQQFWIEENRALALKSTQGSFVLAPESSHALYEDAPDVVLDAIRQLLE